jgi:hypothetical protein
MSVDKYNKIISNILGYNVNLNKRNKKSKKYISGEELYKRVYYQAWNVSDDPLETLELAYDNSYNYLDDDEYVTPAQEKIAKRLIKKEIREAKKL